MTGAPAADSTPDKGPRRPSNRRDLILEAAIDLFHRNGYPATGVDDIGKAVDQRRFGTDNDKVDFVFAAKPDHRPGVAGVQADQVRDRLHADIARRGIKFGQQG